MERQICCVLDSFYRETAMLITVYAVVVCLSVCVCLSHSGIEEVGMFTFLRRDTMLAWHMLLLCVHVSVTSRCYTETAKHSHENNAA